MKKQVKSLEEVIKKLPPEFQDEVIEFVELLLKRRKENSSRKPHFKWAGALAELKGKYTSVELQHKISEWMSND